MGIKTEEIVLSTGKVIQVKQLTVLAKMKLWGLGRPITNADVYMECLSAEDKAILDSYEGNLNDVKNVTQAINKINQEINTQDPKN